MSNNLSNISEIKSRSILDSDISYGSLYIELDKMTSVNVLYCDDMCDSLPTLSSCITNTKDLEQRIKSNKKKNKSTRNNKTNRGSVNWRYQETEKNNKKTQDKTSSLNTTQNNKINDCTNHSKEGLYNERFTKKYKQKTE